MLGIADFWVSSAYLLCVLSTLACVVYGVVNWNKGGESETEQVVKENRWETVEAKMEEAYNTTEIA